jgi:pectate lyase
MRYLILPGLFAAIACSARAQSPDFSLAGFATLNGGTTGGEGGQEVVVSTFENLLNYAEIPSTPCIIYIDGTITGTGSVAAGTYDGLIDITHQTGYLTISWCYFHDHYKTHLIGSNDSDLYADRKITFHHNRYENVSSRLPFYRGAAGYVFNNYIRRGFSGCVNPRLGACLRVEKNYFKDSKNTVFSQHDGFAQRIDNREVNCTNPGSYPETYIASIEYPCQHVLTSDVDSVIELVMEYAGAGKLQEESNAAVRDPDDRQILVYPNPLWDRLCICSPFTQEMDVELINPTGQHVFRRKIFGPGPIELMSPGKGLYFLRLVCGNITINRKIIAE